MTVIHANNHLLTLHEFELYYHLKIIQITLWAKMFMNVILAKIFLNLLLFNKLSSWNIVQINKLLNCHRYIKHMMFWSLHNVNEFGEKSI